MDAEPDLKLQGFSIWIDDREFPDLDDYWDSNWLHIRAVVEASGARVKCDGPILRNTDFDQFRSQLEVLHRSLQGEARLEGLEPNLKLTLKAWSLGHIEAEIEITPDHLNQSHWFSFSLDQSYLPALIGACEAILERFPVKGTPS